MQKQVEKKMQSPPPFSRIAFWDVDFDHLDFEKRSLFVMEKVMNYGVWEDILGLFRFYGTERVRREITQAAYLKKKAISFLCLILDLNESDFKCYTKRQSNPGLWDF